MVVDFSVVICTYNGEKRLPAVLEKLRSQRFPSIFQWEVLIVDNNSNDGTGRLIAQYQLSWPETIPLRYIFEPRQGLAYARRKAIQETNSPLIGFLDDDNLPDANWVNAAYRFGLEHPEAGAYGSEIRGDFEVDPPLNFHQIASCLAVIERGSQSFQYPQRHGILPAGAGVVVRRQAWVANVPALPRLAGVCATALEMKGEDVETLSYIRQGGWPIWHNPEMKLYHYIPAARLEPSYLLQLFQCIGLNRYPLRMLHYASWQRPGMALLYSLSDLYKIVHHFWTTRKLFSSDIVLACRRRLLFSSLVSLIYHWQMATLNRLKPLARFQPEKKSRLARFL